MCGISVLPCILMIAVWSTCRAADCPGIDGHLNGENIANYEGCSRVMGNIIINEGSFQSNPGMGMDESLTVEGLTVLSEVREVDGYVQVENTNQEDLTNLRFLHNLEIIHGYETLEIFPAQYSLIISENSHLQTLNLASLKRIENGGVRITSNPQLCLVDTISIQDYLNGSSVSRSRVGGYAQDCSGVTCHSQCEMSMGCWGTLADECVQCRSFEYRGICVDSCNESISYTDDETMSCIPLPTSTPNKAATTTGAEHSPSPTHSTHNNTGGGTSRDTNRTTITGVQPVVTTTTSNWPQTKAMNTSSPETTLIIFSVTPTGIVLITLIIVLIPLLVVAYRCIKRRKSKLLNLKDDSNVRIKHTKVIQVGKDETAAPKPTLNGHSTVNLAIAGQGTLNRRQHVCTRVASDTMEYNGHHDAASPEPVVVVMVDDNNCTLESSCDEERYTSMPFEQSSSHVTPSPQSYDGHVTDLASHVYDTIDQQPLYESVDQQSLYESVLSHLTIPQSQHSPQMKRNQNTTVSSMRRSHSQSQNSGSPFQRSLTIGGGVYSTRTTSSLQSTSSHASRHSHRGSLMSSSGASAAGVNNQRMSGGRGSRMSHHRLSTAGGSSSRAGTSTQGSMGSGVLPMQE